MTGPVPVAVGQTHPGAVRSRNEDAFLVDRELGLYLVLDGMGGHSGGDVASAMARDIIRTQVAARHESELPQAVIARAFNAASSAIHTQAKNDRGLHGMGTTVVAVLWLREDRVLIAHVGDSRVYLLRGGRLRLLTQDHTVVAELVARGALSPADAAVHPYQSVLSRNLGGKPGAQADINELILEPSDRLLLCSDGLSGFASHEAIEQVMSGVGDPERVAEELIEQALRGGGGDNITAVVLDCGSQIVAESTQELRRTASSEWWARRDLFSQQARQRGVDRSPICAVLSPDEAIEIVAGNLCEAIYRDLEQASALHVWTFAENLANGWLDQGGSYPVLRDLLDALRQSGLAVIEQVAVADPHLAVALETDVLRSLIVAEMAVAGAIGEHMRRAEDMLITQHTEETSAPTFSDEKTTPLMSAGPVEPPSPVVVACLERSRKRCLEELAVNHPDDPELEQCVDAAHRSALSPGNDVDLLTGVRQLFGSRVMSESSVRPLLDALDTARSAHLAALRGQSDPAEVRAAAIRRLAAAHQGLMMAMALMVSESSQALSENFRLASTTTARMRAEVGKNEARLAELERELDRAKGHEP